MALAGSRKYRSMPCHSTRKQRKIAAEKENTWQFCPWQPYVILTDRAGHGCSLAPPIHECMSFPALPPAARLCSAKHLLSKLGVSKLGVRLVWSGVPSKRGHHRHKGAAEAAQMAAAVRDKYRQCAVIGPRR